MVRQSWILAALLLLTHGFVVSPLSFWEQITVDDESFLGSIALVDPSLILFFQASFALSSPMRLVLSAATPLFRRVSPPPFPGPPLFCSFPIAYLPYREKTPYLAPHPFFSLLPPTWTFQRISHAASRLSATFWPFEAPPFPHFW